MNVDEHVVPSGQHYSGRNRVPNIQEFMDQLDAEKKERDAEIDAELKKNGKSKEVHDHKNSEKVARKDLRTVRDPVTGKDVQIRDVKTDYKETVENPQVSGDLCEITPPKPRLTPWTKLSVPNENLGKPATIATSAEQSGEEYRYAQDVTAPPDPVQEGATSDVPIRSEKTSVLFFKTPSVSYEPMFTTLERKGNVLCGGIFIAIVIAGKVFGGTLLGLIPLGFCVASGVFLWIKDLIRQGRDLEWSSEQERGETATVNLIPESVEWMNTMIGIMWGLINPEMFAAVADT